MKEPPTKSDLKLKNQSSKVVKEVIEEEKVNVVENLEPYLEVVGTLLRKIRSLFPQYDMNGEKNIWIMKPSGLSRGRGIACISNLNELLHFIKINSSQYIIQKYIENPLIMLQRKFDIRQWVLVTDFNPLTIWMYDVNYLRFSAEDYNENDIKNLFAHLTNNSISKYSENHKNSKIEGNMWDLPTFTKYLKDKEGRDIYNEIIKEKIMQTIILSLESAKDLVVNRKNSHEVYGFDLMVDNNYNVWLLEINSSPTMEYSTSITEKYVKIMQDDLIKVVLEYNPKSKEKDIKINGYQLIHKGEYVAAKDLPNKETIVITEDEI